MTSGNDYFLYHKSQTSNHLMQDSVQYPHQEFYTKILVSCTQTTNCSSIEYKNGNIAYVDNSRKTGVAKKLHEILGPTGWLPRRTPTTWLVIYAQM